MLRLFSPAKVNLFLRVLGKRSDGYHNIASLFQTVDFGDILTFAWSNTDSLSCSDPSLPTGSNNLIWKAVDLFRKQTGSREPIAITLEKLIPLEAGLGGGSSNAATTLFALNQLFDEPASQKELQQWSGEIGSDTPFFFSQGSAFCEGRGEIVTPVPSCIEKEFWIVTPPFGLSTKEVYQLFDPLKVESRDPKFSLGQFLEQKPEYFNDLEEPAFKIRPELNQFKEELKTMGAKNIRLCGSGSSLFYQAGKALTPNCIEVNPISRHENHWYLKS